MDTITIRDFYRRAQAGDLKPGAYHLTKYGKVAYSVSLAVHGESRPITVPGSVPVDCVGVDVGNTGADVGKISPAAPPVVLDIKPVVVGGHSLKVNPAMAAFLARVPVGPVEPETVRGYPPAPVGFKAWDFERRRAWIVANWPDVAGLENCDELVKERLRAK